MLDCLLSTTLPTPNQVLDENVRHMCVVHSHLLLMLRNISAAEITDGLAKTALCAMAFLATRHQWNKELLDAWGGDGMAPSYDCWRVPEHELYEVLHVLRRKLVLWLREVASQRQLDLVLGGVVRVSEGSGALLPPPRAVPQRWAYLGAADEGRGNLGRFTVHSTRARLPTAQAYAAEAVQAMGREAEGAVVFDVQVMQLTLRLTLTLPHYSLLTTPYPTAGDAANPHGGTPSGPQARGGGDGGRRRDVRGRGHAGTLRPYDPHPKPNPSVAMQARLTTLRP